MKNHAQRLFRVSLIAFLGFAVSWVTSQAQEVSVSGIYLLIEVNGEKLPAASWTKKSNGERCREEVLEGAMFLDSIGRFAAFVTTRDVCLDEDGSETAIKEESVIWPGSYEKSGNQVTLQYEFELWPDPDQAVLNGDLLVLKDEGVGEYEGQSTEFVLRRK
ncbi:MAG: hypothetical protein ACE5OQ_11685 [Woeseia sp.]